MSTAKPFPSAVSARMSRQPSRGTKPEVAVRNFSPLAHYRFRVNVLAPNIPRLTIDTTLPRGRGDLRLLLARLHRSRRVFGNALSRQVEHAT